MQSCSWFYFTMCYTVSITSQQVQRQALQYSCKWYTLSLLLILSLYDNFTWSRLSQVAQPRYNIYISRAHFTIRNVTRNKILHDHWTNIHWRTTIKNGSHEYYLSYLIRSRLHSMKKLLTQSEMMRNGYGFLSSLCTLRNSPRMKGSSGLHYQPTSNIIYNPFRYADSHIHQRKLTKIYTRFIDYTDNQRLYKWGGTKKYKRSNQIRL